ncbi:hypothetical protein FQN49_007360 [Arthroderma sp. PD_2]|nr:hypothetical protein FQN49_007360 [Arthroderma sp. PD_2]
MASKIDGAAIAAVNWEAETALEEALKVGTCNPTIANIRESKFPRPAISSAISARTLSPFTHIVKMKSHRGNNFNVSTITITEYATPSPLDWFQIGCILALYGLGVASAWITPGDKIWNLLAQYFPGGPEWGLWFIRTLVSLVALAHALEVVLFDQWRMRRHGVRRWSTLWWTWEVSCFVEGIRVWNRIDKVIEGKKREKQRKR